MALVVTDDKHYKDIADGLRELTFGSDATYAPEEMARRMLDICYERIQTAHSDGYDFGKQEEYDLFWDAFQDYGNRTNYENAFIEGSGAVSWIADKTYRPKYPLKPTNASSMYYATRLQYDVLKEVDFSDCTDFYRTFSYSGMKQLGVIDMSKATRTTQAFSSCNGLHTIDEIISAQTTPYLQTFSGLKKLENLTITGVIGRNGFDVSESTLLTHDSLMSIIDALYKYSGSGETYTLTLGSTNLAKLSDAEKAIATQQKGWSLLT